METLTGGDRRGCSPRIAPIGDPHPQLVYLSARSVREVMQMALRLLGALENNQLARDTSSPPASRAA
jgi:hypothetical protein